MAGFMSSIRSRNKALSEVTNAARESRGATPRSRPGPVTGSKNRGKGLRAAPAKPARMQTNLPISRSVNRPKSISGAGERQQKIRDIEAKIKALGG